MALSFRPVNRSQVSLLPPDMAEWLPEGHLAWFLIDAVGEMDLSGLECAYRRGGAGAAAYDPAMMLTLLLYAYCCGQRSSRRIEALCVTDIAFRVIAANSQPDHATLARFRARHQDALANLFVQVLCLCREAGLVRAGVVALDGTKIAANASQGANRPREVVVALVTEMFAEAAALDEAEDRAEAAAGPGPEAPTTPAERRARLAAAKAVLDAEEAARAADYEAKVADREERRAANGGKMRGREPERAAKARGPRRKNINLTDPESWTLLASHGRFIQGYNAQAVVDEVGLFVAAEVPAGANDAGLLNQMAATALANLAAAGADPPAVVLADAGYASEEELKAAPPAGPRLLVPSRRPEPHGSTATAAMATELAKPENQALYARRMPMVEPAFAHTKANRGFTRFSRRGRAAADSEWKLVAATHNLMKLFRLGQGVPRLSPAG